MSAPSPARASFGRKKGVCIFERIRLALSLSTLDVLNDLSFQLNDFQYLLVDVPSDLASEVFNCLYLQ